jgi:RNA recognition motif-containing protein
MEPYKRPDPLTSSPTASDPALEGDVGTAGLPDGVFDGFDDLLQDTLLDKPHLADEAEEDVPESPGRKITNKAIPEWTGRNPYPSGLQRSMRDPMDDLDDELLALVGDDHRSDSEDSVDAQDHDNGYDRPSWAPEGFLSPLPTDIKHDPTHPSDDNMPHGASDKTHFHGPSVVGGPFEENSHSRLSEVAYKPNTGGESRPFNRKDNLSEHVRTTHSSIAAQLESGQGAQGYGPQVSGAYQLNNNNKEDTSNHFHIFVGDLSNEVNDEVLLQAFSAFGSVSEARVMWDMKTGHSRGYGFVAFRERVDAEKALSSMDGAWLGSRAIRCGWAIQKGQPSISQQQAMLAMGMTPTAPFGHRFEASGNPRKPEVQHTVPTDDASRDYPPKFKIGETLRVGNEDVAITDRRFEMDGWVYALPIDPLFPGGQPGKAWIPEHQAIRGSTLSEKEVSAKPEDPDEAILPFGTKASFQNRDVTILGSRSKGGVRSYLVGGSGPGELHWVAGSEVRIDRKILEVEQPSKFQIGQRVPIGTNKVTVVGV